MSNSSLGTPEQLRDPNYTPPLGQAIPLGIQHVLAMFVSNVTPAIIVAGVAGFGFGKPDAGNLIYMIQMSMFFAGIATLLQTISLGPIGAKLPIVQGTSFAYLPIMIPAVAGAGVAGMAGLMTGVVVGGLFHFCLGFFIKRIRFALPPLVTGLIVLIIGLELIKVGIEYAAGGAGAFNRGQPDWGSGTNWFVAFVVIAVTLGVKFFSRGFLSVAAVLIGLIAGYIVAAMFGMVSLGGVGRASWFALPNPLHFGWEWNWTIIIGMCLMSFVSAIETVGDTNGITKGGSGREATDEEIAGATYADGVGTAVAGLFGGLPNTSFSQNVGLISMTGVMSRGVVTIGALFLVFCGLIPKVGAIINSVPIEVLGGGVIVMFGMVASAGVRMLSEVKWNRRNMIIFATALSIGLGLYLVPDALRFLDQKGTLNILLTTGLLPAAFIAILLNLLLPEDLDGETGGHETQLSGLGNTGGSATLSNASQSVSAASGAGVAAVTGGAAALAGGAAALASAGSNAASAAGEAAKSTASSAGSAVKSTATSAAKTATSTVKKAAPKKAAAKTPAAKKAAPKRAVAKAAPAKKAAAKKAPAKKAAAKKAPAKGKLAGSAIDDLEFVDGIGPKTAKSLQSAGVKNLSGLIKMSDANLEKAAQKAGTGGRPESEKWKKQAADILGGKAPKAKSDRAAWERAMKKM